MQYKICNSGGDSLQKQSSSIEEEQRERDDSNCDDNVMSCSSDMRGFPKKQFLKRFNVTHSTSDDVECSVTSSSNGSNSDRSSVNSNGSSTNNKDSNSPEPQSNQHHKQDNTSHKSVGPHASFASPFQSHPILPPETVLSYDYQRASMMSLLALERQINPALPFYGDHSLPSRRRTLSPEVLDPPHMPPNWNIQYPMVGLMKERTREVEAEEEERKNRMIKMGYPNYNWTDPYPSRTSALVLAASSEAKRSKAFWHNHGSQKLNPHKRVPKEKKVEREVQVQRPREKEIIRPPRPHHRSCERRGGYNDLVPPGCPLTLQQIVDLDIDAFNDLMTKHKFSEAQIADYKERRRKGKNRQAAQKSRQKKLEAIENLKVLKVQREGNMRRLTEKKNLLQNLLNNMGLEKSAVEYDKLIKSNVVEALIEERGRLQAKVEEVKKWKVKMQDVEKQVETVLLKKEPKPDGEEVRVQKSHTLLQ